MRDGFIKVAAVTPKVVVADPVENTIRIKAAVMEAAANGAKVIVCPELCITGYTCGDLFLGDFVKKRKGAAGMAGKGTRCFGCRCICWSAPDA